MDQIAFFFREQYIYWSSVLLLVAVGVAVFLFLSLYLGRSGKLAAAFSVVPVAVLLCVLCARLVHWYCFSESYSGFAAAMSDFSQGSFALVGVFAGCVLAVGLLYLVKIVPDPVRMLDCMCLAGGAGITVGRLASFFNTTDRGWIMETVQSLPLAAPVINVVSKATEYRFATFMLQSVVTGLLTLVLGGLYLCPKGKNRKDGEISLMFLLCYSAAQVILDSTRYDSMYFRSNGFVSVVQVLGAVAVVLIGVLFSVRLVRRHRFRSLYVILWALMAGLLGCAGYMEYYVQRHGNQTTMSYAVMGTALCAYVAITLAIRALAGKEVQTSLISTWVSGSDNE